MVREGPTDEVPERPGDAGGEGGEETESTEALYDVPDTAHQTGPLFCSAVAVPVPVTVR
jgi:hypothetical protein